MSAAGQYFFDAVESLYETVVDFFKPEEDDPESVLRMTKELRCTDYPMEEQHVQIVGHHLYKKEVFMDLPNELYAIVNISDWKKTAGDVNLELHLGQILAAYRLFPLDLVRSHKKLFLDDSNHRKDGFTDPIVSTDHLFIKLSGLAPPRLKLGHMCLVLDPPFNKTNELWEELPVAWDHINNEFVTSFHNGPPIKTAGSWLSPAATWNTKTRRWDVHSRNIKTEDEDSSEFEEFEAIKASF